MGIAEGVDAGVEAAVRVSQGYCIYAGCFPINVIRPQPPRPAPIRMLRLRSRPRKHVQPKARCSVRLRELMLLSKFPSWARIAA